VRASSSRVGARRGISDFASDDGGQIAQIRGICHPPQTGKILENQQADPNYIRFSGLPVFRLIGFPVDRSTG